MKAFIKINSLLLAIAVLYIFFLGVVNLILDIGIDIRNKTSLPKQVILLSSSIAVSLILLVETPFQGMR